MRRNISFLWFVMGLGSQLQLVASLSITEAIALCAAPFLFAKYHVQMKKNGIMPLLRLSLMVFLGCIVACVANHTPFLCVIRGLAVTTLIPSAIVVSYWLIRKEPNGFKWYLLGGCISIILCTFVFQKQVETIYLTGGENGGASAADIMAGPLFWISRVEGLVPWPTKAFYLHTPIWFDLSTSLFLVVFAMMVTDSGRSAALTTIAYCGFLILGGKTMSSMQRFARNIGKIVLIATLSLGIINVVYREVATRGWLGEKALAKYESQTQGSTSIGRLLVGGRAASFIGLLACRDKPIIGWGPWAVDSGGYYKNEFMTRFGTDEDIIALARAEKIALQSGKVRLIQCHAYITEFWCWYGIWGLIFWLYILFVFARFLKQDCWVVPQWFAWLACGIPGFCWSIFFSPFANRFGAPLFVVACLMARAVRKGTFQLPTEMQKEMAKSFCQK